MSGKEKENDGRFNQLLQPSSNRDLAANWCVDVAQELEEYLAHLSLATLFEDGQNSLNFAEAALLIQGSIQIYSRKVEYLYALVLQALGLIGNKKQAQLDLSSIPGDRKDADIEQDEEEFLNLDDVPEEPNIDIENEGSGGYITPMVRPPASLIVFEGEAMNGDTGEFETYQLATSSLHRDFLLLDPCDAETVDIYLNTNVFSKRSARKTPGHLSSASRSKIQKSNASTPGRRGGSAKRSEAPEVVGLDPPNGFQIGDDAGGRWEDLQEKDYVRNINFENAELDRDSGDSQNDNDFHDEDEDAGDDDPWALLNPHEPGTLPVKPFKRGQLYRKQKLKGHYACGDEVEFPLASRNGVTLPEFAEAWHKLQAEVRRRQNAAGNSATAYEKLRSCFQTIDEDLQKDSFDGLGVSQDNIPDNDAPDEGCEHSDEGCDAPEFLHDEQPEENHVQTETFHLFDDGDHHREESRSFEDLCRAHMDRILRKLAENEVRTELATRVSNWRLKIEINLEEQESRPPFDIHVYGEQIMSKFTSSPPTANDMDCEQGAGMEVTCRKQSFAYLVQGQKSYEVARSFAALLQLVDNGNVTIEQTCSKQGLHCFIREDCFVVNILSVETRHVEMLNYQAPSRAAKAAMKDSSYHQPELESHSVARIAAPKQNVLEGHMTSEDLEVVHNVLQPCSILATRISPYVSPILDTAPARRTQLTRYSKLGTNTLENDSPKSMLPVGGNMNATLSKLTPQGKRRRKIQALKAGV